MIRIAVVSVFALFACGSAPGDGDDSPVSAPVVADAGATPSPSFPQPEPTAATTPEPCPAPFAGPREQTVGGVTHSEFMTRCLAQVGDAGADNVATCQGLWSESVLLDSDKQ